MWSCDMVRIGSCTTACDLAIDLGTSFNGMFQLLKDQYACTFTHYKAIPFLIIGPGGCFRIVIAFTQSFHGVKAANTCFAYYAFSTTCYNNISLTHANQVKGFHHGVGRRSAGTNNGKIRSSETMPHGDMPCSNIKEHLGNEERIKAWRTIAFGKVGHFLLEGDQAPDTAGE